MALVVGLGAIGGLTIHVSNKQHRATTVAAPTYPKAWNPRIAPLARLVSQYRGLQFLHPVYVEFLTPTQFAAQVTANSPSRSQVGGAEDLLRALGLISDYDDLITQTNVVNSSGAPGLYSYAEKRIWINGTQWTPLVKLQVVRELTIALDDQHYDLGATMVQDADNDGQFALAAIIQGDAQRIQDRYRQTYSPTMQKQLETEADAASKRADSGTSEVPGVLLVQLGAADELGSVAVTRIVSIGGNAAVDALFENPPTHDAEVTQPWLLGAPWASVPISAPSVASGSSVDARGELGAYNLYLLLSSQPGSLANDLAAADAWRADRYVVYGSDGYTCLHLTLAGQNTAGTRTIYSSVNAWALRSGIATASTNGATVTLTSCDPQADDFPPPAYYSSTALDLMAARNATETQI